MKALGFIVTVMLIILSNNVLWAENVDQYSYWVPFVETNVRGRDNTTNRVKLQPTSDATLIEIDFEGDGVFDQTLTADANEFVVIRGIHDTGSGPITGLQAGTHIRSNAPLFATYFFGISDWIAYEDGNIAYRLPTIKDAGYRFVLPFSATKVGLLSYDDEVTISIDTDRDGVVDQMFLLQKENPINVGSLPEDTLITATGSIFGAAVTHGSGYYGNTYATLLLPANTWDNYYIIPTQHPYNLGSPTDLSRLQIVTDTNDTQVDVNDDTYFVDSNEALSVPLLSGTTVKTSAPVFVVLIHDVRAWDPWKSTYRHYAYAQNGLCKSYVVSDRLFSFPAPSSHGGPTYFITAASFSDDNIVHIDINDDGIVDHTVTLDSGQTFSLSERDPLLAGLGGGMVRLLSDNGIAIAESWRSWWERRAERAYGVESVSWPADILPDVKTVYLDIKPTSCPNPLNVDSQGVLPVAILGTELFDVNDINVISIELSGVGPIRSSYEDVAAPLVDANECDCTTEGPDGYVDLTLKFETQEIVEALGDVMDGDELVLGLTGCLYDGTLIAGEDCIVIRKKGKP